jgi:hypothetical protein
MGYLQPLPRNRIIFSAALAPGKNIDADPAPAVGTCISKLKLTFLKRKKGKIRVYILLVLIDLKG